VCVCVCDVSQKNGLTSVIFVSRKPIRRRQPHGSAAIDHVISIHRDDIQTGNEEGLHRSELAEIENVTESTQLFPLIN